jgi:ATP-dependent exoDNAse (exonuclease V) alpha subunit
VAVFFMYMKTYGRANGSSAVSAAAYRSGERLRDERTGRVYDHTATEGVLHREIVAPAKFRDSHLGWAQSRESLWNAAEAAEPRKNARVAREFLVALLELGLDLLRLGLVRGFAQQLADRYGFAIDAAIHAPKADPRNHHAHLLATTRELGIEGFGAKTALEINDVQRRARGLEPFFREVIALRERWATATNEALAAAGVAVRVDHRSLEDQGVDREPQPHLPRAVVEIERRGERSFVGERIRAEHRARVAERLARAAAATPAEEYAAGGPPARAALPADLDEVRRRAREAWLELRRQGAAAEPRTQHAHAVDDDLTR